MPVKRLFNVATPYDEKIAEYQHKLGKLVRPGRTRVGPGVVSDVERLRTALVFLLLKREEWLEAQDNRKE
jgi:hypothetical protein